jgi:hypothetical protein
LIAPSIARAVVTNLPSGEIKKPLCVRSKFPFGSKTVTQTTEGRTFVSSWAKSGDGLWSGFASAEGLVEGKGIGV